MRTATVTPRRTTAAWGAVLVVMAAAIATGGSIGLPVAVAAPGLGAIAVTDSQLHRIPNRLLVLTAAAFAVAAGATAGLAAAATSLAAGAAAFAALAATLVLDPRLGAGDVKLAAVTGAVAAWPWAADSAGVLTGALVGLTALTAGLVGGLVGAHTGRPIPLGPSMVVASLAVAIGGLILRIA